MSEKILFLTGRLAEKQLHRVLESMDSADFAYEVKQIGVSVAALMTGNLIRRRVPDARDADRILIPGRCRCDLDALSAHFRVPVERGPDDLKDVPEYFGGDGLAPDLTRHDCLIFAEIVDAPKMDIGALLRQAAEYKNAGADVIDLGCLPDTGFPHLEEAVRSLRQEGYKASVDSADRRELLRGARAGADYLLSLSEETLDLADEVESIPVLIPARPGDLDSLSRAIDTLMAKGKPFLADPVLDPIHFGFTESLVRYHDLRRRYPGVDILMGVGNLTELTGADTTGITALLMGVVSELKIAAILVVQVSPHCRRAVREADRARRIMYLAREEKRLPCGIDKGLMSLHDRRPFAYAPEEIAELAALIRDPSFRVQVGEDGVHVFNRDGHHVGKDPFTLFSRLGLEGDTSHAFYMGVELARAQIAWQLGKLYAQDEELDWGCAADGSSGEPRSPGPTLAMSAQKRAAKRRANRERMAGKAKKGQAERKTGKKTSEKPAGRRRKAERSRR